MRLIDEAALINEAETGGWDIDKKELQMILKYVPTLDAAPVMRGEWIEEGDDLQICSNCGEEHSWDEYRATYCDACGAKMESEGNT